MERAILHLNFVNLAVGLERLHDSGLAGRPVIIAPATARALVHAMSREAEEDGVRRGMPLAAARRRCPRAVVRPPRPEAEYGRFTARCLGPALGLTPLVEPGRGMGHLYLDLTGSRRLLGSAPAMARHLQRELGRVTGLVPAWGLAESRLVARVAARVAKPDRGRVVAPGSTRDFLDPLPLEILPGLRRQDRLRLRELNIRTIGQARRLSPSELAIVCDPARARDIHRLLRGIDPRPVHAHCAPPCPGPEFCHVFSPDTNEEPVVLAGLHDLVLQAGRHLRGRGLGCRRLAVRLEYSDGMAMVRRAAAARGVAADNRTLRHLAVTALYRGWHRRVRLRRLVLSCSGLLAPVHQLSLFSCDYEKICKSIEISRAVDVIHERFGPALVRPARTMVLHRAGRAAATGP